MRHLRSFALMLADAGHDVRHEGFMRLGPVYVTTFGRHFDAVRNGFEIGRDYERGVGAEERADLGARLDRCNAALRQHLAERTDA